MSVFKQSPGRKQNLRRRLDSLTAPMSLFVDEGQEKVRCVACGHRCLIPPESIGVCKVRFNHQGVLYGPRGYVSGLQDDPIEKKPFYHVMPGSRALSFGMLGCDFHCGYCHNWLTSQALRDEHAGTPVRPITPKDLVARAKAENALVITSTYNEPLITAEWAAEVFTAGKAAGLTTSFVSNGNNTREVLEFLRPCLDICNIDLKSFNDRSYRKLGGTLNEVLEGIIRVHEAGIWMELVTLVVPGFNDSPAELREIANFIAGLSPDIPWHVTGFYPNYKMESTPPTPPDTLRMAWETGREAGLRYVYPGNVHGMLKEQGHTWCPKCQTLLVERHGFGVAGYHLLDGKCPKCSMVIPGVWHDGETLNKAEFDGLGAVRPLL